MDKGEGTTECEPENGGLHGSLRYDPGRGQRLMTTNGLLQVFRFQQFLFLMHRFLRLEPSNGKHENAENHTDRMLAEDDLQILV